MLACAALAPPCALIVWTADADRVLATPLWALTAWAAASGLWLLAAALTYVPFLGRAFAALSPGARASPERAGLITFTRTKRALGVHFAGVGAPYGGAGQGAVARAFHAAGRRVRDWRDAGEEPADKPVFVDTWVDGRALFEAGFLRRMGFLPVGRSPPVAWWVWAVSLFVHVAPGCHARGDFAPLRKWARGPRRWRTTVGQIAAVADVWDARARARAPACGEKGKAKQ